MRKVSPLERALKGFHAWISGRKRYHGDACPTLPVCEWGEADRIKINSVAGWSKSPVEQEFVARALPRHPLEAKEYMSIGAFLAPLACAPARRWARAGGAVSPRGNAALIVFRCDPRRGTRS